MKFSSKKLFFASIVDYYWLMLMRSKHFVKLLSFNNLSELLKFSIIVSFIARAYDLGFVITVIEKW